MIPRLSHVLILVAVLSSQARTAYAERAVVLDFSGPQATALEEAVREAVTARVVATSTHQGHSSASPAGDPLVFVSAHNRKRHVAKPIGVVVGTIQEQSGRLSVSLEVHSGDGAPIGDPIVFTVGRPRLVGALGKRVARDLLATLADLPVAQPDEADEADASDATESRAKPPATAPDVARSPAAATSNGPLDTAKEPPPSDRSSATERAHEPPAVHRSAAGAVAPLRIYLDCQSPGRTKACPTFLLGFLDESPLLGFAPRAVADVVLYVNATELASRDRVQLRFVGEVAGAPPVVEALTVLDTRAADDDQRDQLRPAFLRGVALFVAARRPDAVAVALNLPVGVDVVLADSSPWGISLALSGFGSWTKDFQNTTGQSVADLSRVTPTSKIDFKLAGSLSDVRQPSLVIDGKTIAINTDQYSLSARVTVEHHLSDHWALGASTDAVHQDPLGQFRYQVASVAGVEWDHYRADDPRGNALGISYVVGYDVDDYNVLNDLDEHRARYPTHEVIAGAAVRKDKVTYGLYLDAWAALADPAHRHRLSASPSLAIALGAHLDLSLSLSVTELANPGPKVIDPDNFGQVTRATYAEPLTLFGSFDLRIHLDPTNGARNDRFGNVSQSTSLTGF